jgi:AcrR family transcriptional regulator
MSEAGAGPKPPRSRRADARRNRGLLLSAAREIFAERGPDAPLDDIARRAGVGSATMYRHFPTRRELIIAVYADEAAALCATGDALLAAWPAGEALFTWLHAFAGHVAGKRDLALAIPAEDGGQRTALFDGWHEAMHATASRLLAAAQSAGAVSADLDAADLLALASGIAVASADADQARRCLALIRRGTAP